MVTSQRPLANLQLRMGQHLLANPDVRVKSVLRNTDAGARQIALVLSHKTNEMEIVFDPKANYLVRKRVLWLEGKSGTKRLENEILSFKEVKPSIYFPEKAVERYYFENKLAIESLLRFSDIKVNDPIPPATLKLSFPPGILVTDQIEEKVYKVGPDGQYFEPCGRVFVKTPPLTEGNAMPRGGPTDAEPKSLTRWLLPIALLVLFLAGMVWLRQRLKSSG